MPQTMSAALGSWPMQPCVRRGDADALRRILDEYQDGADAVEGEGIVPSSSAYPTISLAKDRVAAIERELVTLRQAKSQCL